MSKSDIKDKYPEISDQIEKDDSWKNRIELLLMLILDELRKVK